MKKENLALKPKQRKFFELIESSFDNFLIHGEPGTGKSVLTRALRNDGNKPWTVGAPTGLAALNGEGKTLHSLFGIPTSENIIPPDYDVYPTNDRVLDNIQYNIKALIIDEISMVRVDIFEYVDRVLRHVKGVDKPFGGIQMILVGDFYQLPPVAKREDLIELKKCGWDSPFVFSSKLFQGFKILTLNEVLRQKDKDFIDILNAARTGSVHHLQLLDLNDRVQIPNDVRIKLCSKNKDADFINQTEMNKLLADPETFTAAIYGEWPAYPVETELRLKVGAQVMVKLNGADRPNVEKIKGEFNSRVVNGTLGKITEIFRAPRGGSLIIGEDKIQIEKENGELVWIYCKTWERKKKIKGEDGKWEEVVIASFTQMPLIPAWAISIHKSQGQSFDKAHIDATKIFAPGQLYVALSRVRTLEGITLEKPLKKTNFWTDPSVTKFFQS